MRLDVGPRPIPSSPFWPRCAIALCLVFLLGIACRLVISGGTHSVYPILADAARSIQMGSEVYWPYNGLTNHDVYRYSPTVAQILAPIGMLPDRLASVLWLALNGISLLVVCHLWTRHCAPFALQPAQKAAFLITVFVVALGSLNNSQTNPIVTALLLGAAAGVCTERWTVTACCIAIATLFKVYPLSFGLVLLLIFPRQFMFRLPAALALGLLLPFFFHAPEYVLRQYDHWIDLVSADERKLGPLSNCYRDLWLAVRLFHLPISPLAYAVLQGIGALAVAGACLVARVSGLRTRELVGLSLNLCILWMILLGPATESSTYTILGPALGWAIVTAWSQSSARGQKALLLSAVACLAIAHAAVWFSDSIRLWLILGQPAGALAILTCVVWNMVRDVKQARNGDAREMRPVVGRAAA